LFTEAGAHAASAAAPNAHKKIAGVVRSIRVGVAIDVKDGQRHVKPAGYNKPAGCNKRVGYNKRAG